MYPWRRILIPTDFSTASEWVFDEAVRIAGMSTAEIVILHIRMTHTSHPQELRFPADARVYEYAEQSELDKLRDRIKRANPDLLGSVSAAPVRADMGEKGVFYRVETAPIADADRVCGELKRRNIGCIIAR